MTEYKQEEWKMVVHPEDYEGLAKEFGISQTVARIIRNRDIVGEEAMKRYLHGKMEDCHDPALMKDMDKGCRLMKQSIEEGQKIRIVSDYDVDGITSNYILYDGLRRVGADISYDIPDRIADGYGINTRIVEAAREDGIRTIITCDNGIAAFPAIELAKEYGMTVIVTDHHEVVCDIDEAGHKTFRYPMADAIIDIHQEDCKYPYKGLCGAGTAYKFIQHLYGIMNIPWPEDAYFDEIVALGTVCDIMPLTDENRILVQRGLQKLTFTNNVGLRALKKAMDLEGAQIYAHHLGFRIGPCLNSSGRLQSAKQAVELLLTEDEVLAAKLAQQMVQLNEERKDMTNRGVKEGLNLVRENQRIVPSESGIEYIGVGDDKVIVLYLPQIHESVAGLVASKVKDAFYRPTLVFTDAENANALKGSGRSIEAYNMYEELSKHRELFVHFGGHAMAAGFTIQRENFELLRQTLNTSHTLTKQDLIEVKYVDASIAVSMITESLYEELKLLEPYGMGNPKPLFGLLHMRIRRVRMVGKEGQYAKVVFATQTGSEISGMMFEGKEFIDNIKEWFGSEECDRILNGEKNNVMVDVLYHPDKNEYNGRVIMQIQPVSIRKSQI